MANFQAISRVFLGDKPQYCRANCNLTLFVRKALTVEAMRIAPPTYVYSPGSIPRPNINPIAVPISGSVVPAYSSDLD